MNPGDPDEPSSDLALAAQELDERCQTAFERMERRIRAVPESLFRTINLHIPTLVTTAHGVFRNVMAHEAELVKAGFDPARVEDMLDYALALSRCHAVWRAAAEPAKRAQALAQRARKDRRRLHRLAIALVTDGLLDGDRVSQLRGGNGYLAIAYDVLGLVELYHEAWDHIAGKTSITRAEVDEARLYANRVIFELGEEKRKAMTRFVEETTLLRRQAYSLFVTTYAEVRKAVGWARREQGDVDRIIPSLFAERGLKSGETKRRKAAAKGGASAPEVEPVAARLVAAEEEPVPFDRQLPASGLDSVVVPWSGVPRKRG